MFWKFERKIKKVNRDNDKAQSVIFLDSKPQTVPGMWETVNNYLLNCLKIRFVSFS